jgi:hypothetical protein
VDGLAGTSTIHSSVTRTGQPDLKAVFIMANSSLGGGGAGTIHDPVQVGGDRKSLKRPVSAVHHSTILTQALGDPQEKSAKNFRLVSVWTVPVKLGMTRRQQQTKLLRARKSPNLASMIYYAAAENAKTNPRWKEKVWHNDGISGPR